MIRIKPTIDHTSACPHCRGSLQPQRILWQGIHVCAVSVCTKCHAEIIGDLPVGQARYTPCQFDHKSGKLFCSDQDVLPWFGNPFGESLRSPQSGVHIALNIEKFSKLSRVIILNCIDYLYGHSLLKLLNAEDHLKRNPEMGLILIIPSFLRWMVPEGVAEIWSVDIPLSRGQVHYPDLDRQIQKECERFEEIFVSRAHSHPVNFDISSFTRVQKHDFNGKEFRITFIWREDRPWMQDIPMVFNAMKKVHLQTLLLIMQRDKITRLFKILKKHFDRATFTIAGMGRTSSFPRWIDDRRVNAFDDESERKTCRLYSESRLVIGIHGSNMLLPSAHAGSTIDLMPHDRWPNFAQDIVYQERDVRMSSYRYRFLPVKISPKALSRIVIHQIQGFTTFREMMTAEHEQTGQTIRDNSTDHSSLLSR
jgi:hypothetical protein